MRLHSITVRNYRIHRDLTVEFKGPLTLIGGPNECGKSTLIEALHRALFLRSKTTGEVQKSMVSTCHAGAPEVEVRFTAGGADYVLAKRFSGANGTTRLVKVGGDTVHGDEAESQLAALLKVESVGGGRGVGERVAQQWLHLWVWQGQSTENPAQHASQQKDNLLQRLQKTGARAALQSELDARLATAFAQRKAALFRQDGKPKTGSPLDQSEIELTEALAEERRSSERLTKLQNDVRDFEEATRDIARYTEELRALNQQQEALKQKLDRVGELRPLESEQSRDAAAARQRRQALHERDARIAQIRASIDSLRATLEPKSAEIKQFEAALATARACSTEAGQRHDQAAERTRTCRQRRDLAAACVSRDEKEARLQELVKKEQQAGGERERLNRLREELARIPELTAPKVKKLEKLQADLNESEAGLRGMAAGIEVLAATEAVRVAGVTLTPGQTHIVTEQTELVFGESLRLRISPGGGTALQEARRKVQELRSELRAQFDKLGIASVPQAVEAFTRRRELSLQVETAEAALVTLEADQLAGALAQARESCAAAVAEVERRRSQLPEPNAREMPSDPAPWLAAEEHGLQLAEREEKEARLVRDAALQALTAAEQALARRRAQVEEDRSQLTGLTAQLALLIQTHGDETTRNRALAEASAAENAAEAALASTQRQLRDLQPELLQEDQKRLRRALERATSAKSEAEKKRLFAEAALRLDGTEDPKEAQALAAARLRSAEEHRAGARRKAEAIRLLDRLYAQQQHVLSDELTRPLAERISGYLQCLFGTGCRAVMTLSSDGFQGLQLVRPTEGPGADDFDSLSGGAREQVAAAVRLAMAEILAGDHDGCLPVVLDDAFAYSDPDRVQTLQRMLDLAATRGLQLIILTCNPSDYAALGAHQITLCRGRPLPTTATE